MALFLRKIFVLILEADGRINWGFWDGEYTGFGLSKNGKYNLEIKMATSENNQAKRKSRNVSTFLNKTYQILEVFISLT